jgi:predicted component of type VI protein secretion system
MYQVEDIRMPKKCNTPSDNKKLKEVIEETLSKYNSRLKKTVAEEGYGDGKKVQMISEFIDDLNAVKKVCVDRNRF